MSIKVGPMSGAGRRPQSSTASLYIGDLANDVTEAALFKLFNAVGPVASIRVCRDAVSKASLGYGYVNFHNSVDAERALDTLNFTTVGTTPIRIMWSERDPKRRKNGKGNVIVKKLDKSIDHKTLFDTFSIFGDILSCKVAFNEKTGESLHYGFVHFASEHSAEKCVMKVNDMEIAGQKVTVERWQPLSERIKNFTNIYVRNVPGDFNKQQFEDMFTKYGPLKKLYDAADSPFIMAKPRQKFPDSPFDTYWGFCNFEEHAHAELAVQKLSGEKVDNGEGGETKEIYCSRALTRGEKLRGRKKRFRELRDRRRSQSKFVNVFVKNLSEKIDDDRLRDLFKEFGEFASISSVKVARDENNHSKGFGFVCYKEADQATRAITEMNTKIVEGKPLYVAPHQPRDERSQELHRRFSTQNRAYQTPRSNYSTRRTTNTGYNTGGGYAPYNTGYQTHTASYQQQQMTRYAPYAQQQHAYTPMMTRTPGPNTVMQRHTPYNTRPAAAAPRRPSYSGPHYSTPMHSHPAPPPPTGQNRQYHDQPSYETTPSRHSSRRSSSGSANLSPEKFREMLSKSDPQQQKQMIGEKLFPMIQSREPKLAGKITGMLLEMDNTELLHLLDTPDSLFVKINEALHVLRRHQAESVMAQRPGTNAPLMVLNTPKHGASQFAHQTPMMGGTGVDATPE